MTISRSTYEALSIETYTAFDVETTGLDAGSDEILEVGIVRVREGRVRQRYDQLFRPEGPIPRAITQLTGIHPEDCIGKPSLESRLPEIIDFIGGDWIVAHNSAFDMAFLNSARHRYASDRPKIEPNRIIDTLELSRILLPWLPNHRLETVAQHLGVPVVPEHRALTDAESTAYVFRELLPLVLSLDDRMIQAIERIYSGTSDGLRFFFNAVSQLVSVHGTKKRRLRKGGLPNIQGRPADSREEEVQPIRDEDIDGYFRPGGVLSRVFSEYESRTPQQEMARCVNRGLREDGFLVAEAGTGVGKSLAYLVPSVLWTVRGDSSRVVISTHTKTLQYQLFNKDLPLLMKCIPSHFMAVLLKGRNNYLCLRRWIGLLQEMEERLSPRQRRTLLPLVVWAWETQTGDIEENAGFHAERNHETWIQLNCQVSLCRGQQCVFFEDCFFHNIRRASRSANVVIVNHALLFSDMVSDFTALGDYDTLIIDEAHQVEKVASQCLSRSLQPAMVRELVRRLCVSDPEPRGNLVQIQRLLGVRRGGRSGDTVYRTLEKVKMLTAEVERSASDFFQSVERKTVPDLTEGRRTIKKRIAEPSILFDAHAADIAMLNESLERLEECLSELNLHILDMQSAGNGNLGEIRVELESILQSVVELRTLVDHFLSADAATEVLWCEYNERWGERQVSLHSVPIDVSGILAESLYTRLRRCVMTSATLTVGGSFDYIMGRLGINRIEEERRVARTFGSPFDFSEQALILMPAYLANPREAGFSREAAFLIDKVLSLHPWGAMVLFTSHQMLREVHGMLLPSLERRHVRLLGQGLDGSRNALLKIFQEDRSSVLLGTSSFWEGVDVPGSALEMLVITKLPFDVPTEPMVEARTERAEVLTGNGFMNYVVPEAVVRFRQGIGRLIRTIGDRGVILLLDRRIVDTQYGKLFRESLPVDAKICKDESSVVRELEAWKQTEVPKIT